MGLLSSIGNAVKSAAQTTVGKAITGALDTLSGVVTNPVVAITKGTTASTKAFTTATPITNVVKTITNVGLAAAAVVGLGAVASGGTAAVTSAASKLIPTTTKGKVIATVAAPIVAGAVIKQPAAAAQAVLNTPSSLANFGGNAAELVANPSLSNAKTLVTENPVVASVVGGAAVLGAGVGLGTVAGIITNVQNTKAVKENTAATLGGSPEVESGIRVIDKSGSFSALPVAQNNAPIPQTAQTQKVTSTTAKRKTRRAKKAVIPSVNQRVNVIVANRNTSVGMKNYLKREVLLN